MIFLLNFLFLSLSADEHESKFGIPVTGREETISTSLNSKNPDLLVFYKEGINGTLFRYGQMSVLETDTVIVSNEPYCFISSTERQGKFHVGWDDRIYSVETDESNATPSITIGFGKATDPDSVHPYAHALICIFQSNYSYYLSSIEEHIDRITDGAIKIEGSPRGVQSIIETCEQDPTCV
ncbi:MAG: hypothetical protein OXB84_07130 [Halobacteriovoraceae bacterium]|nr:hypothetical protein [Halobacteriovoraceae bacterium]